ncbi:hypothetical protein RCL1_005842 [Eukaryota sp. TZLM3-RCL]
MPTTLVFLNPESGNYSDALVKLFEQKDNSPCSFDIIKLFDPSSSWPTSLDQYSSVIIAGGDDTIRQTTQSLLPMLSSDLPLYFFPAGTVNDLCRALNIPLNLNNAFDLFKRLPAIKKIDYGMAYSEQTPDGLLFFSRVATGFLSILQERVIRYGPPSSSFSYYKQVLPAFVSVSPENYVLKIDDKIIERRSIGIFICNAKFMGGLNWSNEIDISDSHFDVLIYTAESMWEKMRLLKGFATGFHAVGEHIRCKKVSILEPKGLAVLSDGEMKMETPINVEISDRQLSTIVPL